MPSCLFHAPAPTTIPATHQALFLGGSIEMGAVVDWQSVLSDVLLRDFENLTVFNPRRPDWDASWVQSLDNPNFDQQVTWEVDHMEASDIVLFYFHPQTKAPVTLLELGLLAPQHAHGKTVIVVCPDGFWRKGNVDFVCRRFGLVVLPSVEAIPDYLREKSLAS
jgi:hypothetical protein